jgi:radical SAM protein with 4Fe4S-binding SPASM domain
MCDIWRERQGRTLTADQIETMIPEWLNLGIARVIVCGEPLLHTEIVPICAAIRSAGIKLDLLTNGLLLHQRARDVARSCDVLQVSLDGPAPIHNLVRGLDLAFERLRAGVETLREAAPEISVDGRCAVHRLNFRHLRETVATAREIGLRTISFSATDLHNADAFRRQQNHMPAYVEELMIRGSDLDVLKDELLAIEEENAADFTSHYISDSITDLKRSLLEYYCGMSGVGAFPMPLCNAPWTSAVLEYDGTVRPCFPLSACGNVFDEGGLHAVLNNEASRSLRRTLDVTTNDACLRCVCQTKISERATSQWRNNPKAASWTTVIR